MFRLVLLCCCLLQRKHETTEGHRGTDRHVFYVVHMDGGTLAVKALAEQHGLEFIQRVSACLKLLLLPPPMGMQLQNPVTEGFFFLLFKSCQSADFYFLLERYLTFIKLQQHFWIFYIWSKPHREAHTHRRSYIICSPKRRPMRMYIKWSEANLSSPWEILIRGDGSSWMPLEMIGSLAVCLSFNLPCWNPVSLRTACDLSTSILQRLLWLLSLKVCQRS